MPCLTRPAGPAVASPGDASFDSHLLTAMRDDRSRHESRAATRVSPDVNDQTRSPSAAQHRQATTATQAHRRQTGAAADAAPERNPAAERAGVHTAPSPSKQSPNAPDRDQSPDRSERNDVDDPVPADATTGGQASATNQSNAVVPVAPQGDGLVDLQASAAPAGDAIPAARGGVLATSTDASTSGVDATAALPSSLLQTLPAVGTPSAAADDPLDSGDPSVAADELDLAGAQPAASAASTAASMPAAAGDDAARVTAKMTPAPEMAAHLGNFAPETTSAASDAASTGVAQTAHATASEPPLPTGTPTPGTGDAPPPAKAPSLDTAGAVVAAAAADAAPSPAGAFEGSDTTDDGNDLRRDEGEPYVSATTTIASANASEKAAKPGIPIPSVPGQVAVQIVRAAHDGVSRLQVMLAPDTLGRLEISLEIHRDGRVSALITADNPQTLDVLRGEARALAQSLNSAGLQADQESLTFAFRATGDGASGHTPGGSSDQNQPAAAPAVYRQGETDTNEAGTLVAHRSAVTRGGPDRLDIRA